MTTMLQKSNQQGNNESVVSSNVVDNASGVEKRNWYVGIVRRNTECAVSERLTQNGYENYVATQKQHRRWKNGRKAEINKVVISTIVFVKVTERERMQTLKEGFINRYMVNPSSRLNDFGRHALATVSEKEMQSLKFLLFHADNPVEFSADRFLPGEAIRVVRGHLKGLEGKVIEHNDKLYVYVSLDILGCAKTLISIEDVEKI